VPGPKAGPTEQPPNNKHPPMCFGFFGVVFGFFRFLWVVIFDFFILVWICFVFIVVLYLFYFFLSLVWGR